MRSITIFRIPKHLRKPMSRNKKIFHGVSFVLSMIVLGHMWYKLYQEIKFDKAEEARHHENCNTPWERIKPGGQPSDFLGSYPMEDVT